MILLINTGPAGSVFTQKPVKDALKQDFLSLLKGKLGDAVEKIHKSEQIGIAAATDQVDVHTLVTAFNNAELSIKMLVTISEKLLSVIQDITKMQI